MVTETLADDELFVAETLEELSELLVTLTLTETLLDDGLALLELELDLVALREEDDVDENRNQCFSSPYFLGVQSLSLSLAR